MHLMISDSIIHGVSFKRKINSHFNCTNITYSYSVKRDMLMLIQYGNVTSQPFIAMDIGPTWCHAAQIPVYSECNGY